MAKKKAIKSKSQAKPQSKKIIWTALVVLLLIVGGILITKSYKNSYHQASMEKQSTTFDFGNKTIILDGQSLIFVNGKYENSDRTYDTHTAIITNQSVNPAGNRAAAILVDNPGGSGTFYYLVGALVKDNKETYSQPVLLGDRIKIISVKVDDPQAYDNGMITVKILDRPSDAPMATEPTIQKTMKYAFEDNGNLIAVIE